MKTLQKLFAFSLLLPLFTSAQHYDSPDELGLKTPASLHCTSVKDQSMSGTCWSFSSVSLLESEMIRKGLQPVDLSEMFIARYSYIRKIERYLASGGKTFFTPGGQFHDLAWVVNNYGMVPDVVYNGRPHGEASHDHGMLDTLMVHFVNGLMNAGVKELSVTNRTWADSVLNVYLGVVPADFTWKGESYTPKSFFEKVVKLKMSDYIEITSYTHHPYNTWFVLEDKYNWTGDAYFNVSFADFQRLPKLAFAQKATVGWDGDADDPDFHFFESLAYLSTPVKNTAAERQEAFTSQLTLLDHMMHMVAAAKDKYGKTWYYVKNSWGAQNATGGFLWMREDYFLQRTDAIIVPRAVLPAALRMAAEKAVRP